MSESDCHIKQIVLNEAVILRIEIRMEKNAYKTDTPLSIRLCAACDITCCSSHIQY